MGFFDRIRSGLRSIGERLHILKAESPPAQRKEIASLERKVERMEQEIRPMERRVEERIDPEDYDTGYHRYSVSIRYRPVDSTKATRTRTAVIAARNPAEAIAILESELDREPDWFYERKAERTDNYESQGQEGPSRGT